MALAGAAAPAATTTHGLAAVAWSETRRAIHGNRAAEGMAIGRSEAGLERRGTRAPAMDRRRLSSDRIYVQGSLNQRSSVHALDRATGKILWSVPIGPEGDNDRGDGPRSTPTVEGGHLWVMTESGDLACLKTADGSVVWKKNALTDFKGRNPHWLLSESPLVDGEHLVFTPGGRGAAIVKLDKMTRQVDLVQPGSERRGGIRLLHRLRGWRRADATPR